MIKLIKIFNKKLKLQSAMEYLITYGWAILILAIALSALFFLGVFNSSNSTGQICKINQGFDCIDYYMNTTGSAVFTITQTSATYINITSIGCSSDPNNQHLVQYSQPSQQIYLPYGTAYSFILQCYTATGKPSLKFGDVFSGSIYINYVNDVTGFPGSAKGSFVIKPDISNTVGIGSVKTGFVPITLENFQSTGIQSNFQQMIYFNPSSYSAYETPNLSNIEFTRGLPLLEGGTPLYSWIESGASSTSTNTVVWVNLGSTTLGSQNNYISVNVINSQSAATGTNFQQMIYFDPSSYSSYEASNLGNIRFYYGNNELYSWCESGCTSTSSNAIFWINTNSLSIGADSYATVNMIFEPTSTNYDGVYAGEAPQLSSTYAQYDNGANVFDFYDNFEGTTINTALWSVVSGGTAIVNNGLNGIQNGGSPVSITSVNTYNPNNEVLDANANVMGFAGGLFHAIGIYNGASGITESWIIDGSNPNYYYLDNYNGANGNSISFNPTYPTLSPTTNYVFSNWESSTESYATVNYGTAISNPNDFRQITSANIGLKQFSTSYALNIQWIRLRKIPPNAIMPSFQFSSVESGDPFGSNNEEIYLNFLTDNSPVTSGYTGYAPQLYCTTGCEQSSYAQYDNGQNVFTGYWNFKGTTLPNGWTDSGDTTNVIVNNDLSIKTGAGGWTYVHGGTTYNPNNYIIDAYISPEQTCANEGGIGWGITGTILDSWTVNYCGTNEFETQLFNNAGNFYYSNFLAFSPNPVFSVYGTSNEAYFLLNYGSLTGYTNDFSTISNGVPDIQAYNPTGINVQWIDVRELPPNGVMPIFSFGSLSG
ncbi:MAG: hypothetical protein QXD23_02100 [Candidatus Micrarchaeaceae archaeon]